MRISDWSSDVCSSDLLRDSFRSHAHLFPEIDQFFARSDGFFRVGTGAGPITNPLRRIAKKLCRPVGVREENEQVAMILVLPLLKHLILRISQRFGIIRVTLALQSREHHRQLVRIRSLGLEAVFESQVNIGSPGKPVAKHLLRSEEHTSELQSLMRI